MFVKLFPRTNSISFGDQLSADKDHVKTVIILLSVWWTQIPVVSNSFRKYFGQNLTLDGQNHTKV